MSVLALPSTPVATPATAIFDTQSTLDAWTAARPAETAGAAVTFVGLVRNHDHGREVIELEYVGHPTAPDVLARLAAEVRTRHPEVGSLRVAHWTGLLTIGDTALHAEVEAAHRQAAFAACADLVETVKAGLPIWKRQRFADGTDEWVNCP